MTVTVVANQKGGVGKTTTAANVGVTLALRGQRVLVVDEPDAVERHAIPVCSVAYGGMQRQVVRQRVDERLGDGDTSTLTIAQPGNCRPRRYRCARKPRRVRRDWLEERHHEPGRHTSCSRAKNWV
jgi:AAA domain